MSKLRNIILSSILALNLGVGFNGCTPNGPEIFDYCSKKTARSSEVNKFVAGKDVEFNQLIEGDREELNKLEILPEEIITSDELSKYKLNIVFVPVGYEDNQKLEEKMTEVVDIASEAFERLPLNFAYLNKSVPVELEYLERIVFFSQEDDAKFIYSKISKVYPGDKLVFIINTEKRVGISQFKGKFALLSGEVDLNYVLIHEMGHLFALDDGYQRYYPKSSLNGSELFFDKSEIPRWVSLANVSLNAPEIPVNGVCNGKQVYSFYENGTDIMDRSFTKEQIEKMIAEDSLFNPLQKEIMNLYVRDETKWKYRGLL